MFLNVWLIVEMKSQKQTKRVVHDFKKNGMKKIFPTNRVCEEIIKSEAPRNHQ